MDPELVREAVVIWTGWERTSWPARDDLSVTAKYGDELGRKLLRVVHRLASDFNLSEAHRTVPGLVEMGEEAKREFEVHHPELHPDIAQALT